MHSGRAGYIYPHVPLVLKTDPPDCSVCGAECHWSVDAWVCTDNLCGSEWYSDHGTEYAAPTTKVTAHTPREEDS
jgi:hypothetical protein